MLLVLLVLLELLALALLALLVLLSMSSHLVPGVDDEIYIFGSKGNRWARGAQPPRPRPALQPTAAELTSPFSPCATQKPGTRLKSRKFESGLLPSFQVSQLAL